MAAPPIPPKGNSNSWLRDNRVTDPLPWKAETGNLFSNDTKSRAFSDNFTPTVPICAPPLPPRRPNEPAQKLPRETNELALIPPPPGTGQLYRNNPDNHKPKSKFSSANTTNSSLHTDVQNTLFQNISSGNVNPSFSYGLSSSSQFSASTVSSFGAARPLAFSNTLYHQGNSKGLPLGMGFQYNGAASNMYGSALSSIASHRFPNDNFSASTVSYATINHNVNINNNNSQPNLENILKFMKKRSDSNLIDLFCGEDEKDNTKSQTNKSYDDILKLFDPLSIKDMPTTVQSKTEIATGTEVNINLKNDQGTCDGKSKSHVNISESDSERNIRQETVPKYVDDRSDVPKSPKKVKPAVLKILFVDDNYNKEITCFCDKLKALRKEFSYDDHVTNPGLVISPTLDSYQDDSLSIKLIINSINSERPVSFTCDVNTSIEHIISHTVCTIFDDASSICMDNFVLKVQGLAEYFTSHSVLADYEYVHQCHKFDKPVCLTLTDIKDLKRPLARTKRDDVNDVNFKCKDIANVSRKEIISYDSLSILLDTFEKEIEKIKSSALQTNIENLKPQAAIQAVKAICTLLSHVETPEITTAVAAFIKVCLLFEKNENSNFESSECSNKKDLKTDSDILNMFELLELSLSHLKNAIHELLVMYTNAFRVNFELEHCIVPQEEKMVTDFLDTPLFEVGVVHRLEPNMISQFESFFIVCEMYHGDTLLSSLTTRLSVISKSFFHRIEYEQWLQFENVAMCTLPQETVLYFVLWANIQTQTESKQSNNNAGGRACLGWCGLRFFSYENQLAQGSFLLGFWPSEVMRNSGPLLSNPGSNCPLLQIRLPDFGCIVKFPPVLNNRFASSQIRSFESLDSHLQRVLRDIIDQDPLKALVSEEKELLWENKYYLHNFPNALPKILLSAHGWDWACLSDIYSLLKSWRPMSPVDSLHLLIPSFPNRKVRETAICWMKEIVSDELCDYLPQIVQVLRYEPWDDSPTAWFLLERSLTSVRVAHHLYWLLKENLSDPIVGDRMQLMLNSLLAISGSAMCNRIKTQESLLESLSAIADKIKTTKESLRLSSLFYELEITHHELTDNQTCLPLSPSLEVSGIDVKSCSYFTSNTLPLRLVFTTPEFPNNNHEAIFKVGDDIRQDMITIQMIRIMDKLWLKEGLDLKIVTFACVATDYRKGMVELVLDAETLRKIQTELGLTGSFKDRPIAEWLQKYNTSELEYQQAVENFTLSCAGYCVATYILGICDRHNDNIMLKTSGHIFHIDFGKFLGDSQMFGNIKRDRTPFVLTSDMAYVINGGDKPSKKFQYFIDLCCQAFNIIRKHKNIFFNLFMLMTSSGIPGMTSNAVNYIEKALLLGMTEAEATAHFTHLIQDSLKSWFTQFNFFIHNLAQLRFTGDHNEGLLLSFIPKTFSKETDGKILLADVIGYQKMYDPEKYYLYVVKLERENLPDSMCVFRTYREFVEFHQKLCMMFPLAKFHPLRGNPLMGRANVREVAEKRKMELSSFLSSLMNMAKEISHCDLVYTFFHPLLRDQEGMVSETKNRSPKSRRSSSLTEIHGQIKLSIVYKNNSLFIMVMHAKNLSSSKGRDPDPYVKTYLLPDTNKSTKRKTKIASKNCHPTFMEMIVYNLPLDVVQHKALHVSIWDYDRVQENEFLGAALIPLSGNLSKEIVQWYPLGQFNY
ncbi:phosphatidylinositol 4-phosphate 3-kinase C2 domain-containing subunit alpha-like [Uloborus diversus]|uniref:phosphatidylinositol 4-phosphate 3-kinase C2 domain-containing subunit alpha-like n=1 Tax=Uloborus diversus TaxID=327109 RepID=UPI00240A74FA|nr:phosphatidylinositol 4-phosphate 3-kinase C2 domain-containing subunit alpha-like [Uloborus diversus]